MTYEAGVESLHLDNTFGENGQIQTVEFTIGMTARLKHFTWVDFLILHELPTAK
jgi:hypothetical protein